MHILGPIVYKESQNIYGQFLDRVEGSRGWVRAIMASWLVCGWLWEEGVFLVFVTCLGKERQQTGGQEKVRWLLVLRLSTAIQFKVLKYAKTTVFCGITLGLSQKIIREVWKYILKT